MLLLAAHHHQGSLTARRRPRAVPEHANTGFIPFSIHLATNSCGSRHTGRRIVKGELRVSIAWWTDDGTWGDKTMAVPPELHVYVGHHWRCPRQQKHCITAELAECTDRPGRTHDAQPMHAMRPQTNQLRFVGTRGAPLPSCGAIYSLPLPLATSTAHGLPHTKLLCHCHGITQSP